MTITSMTLGYWTHRRAKCAPANEAIDGRSSCRAKTADGLLMSTVITILLPKHTSTPRRAISYRIHFVLDHRVDLFYNYWHLLPPYSSVLFPGGEVVRVHFAHFELRWDVQRVGHQHCMYHHWKFCLNGDNVVSIIVTYCCRVWMWWNAQAWCFVKSNWILVKYDHLDQVVHRILLSGCFFRSPRR